MKRLGWQITATFALIICLLAACADARRVGEPEQASPPSAGLEASATSNTTQPRDADNEAATIACTRQTRPGDPCDPALGDQCLARHCGATLPLECRADSWQLVQLSWQGESSPYDFMCALGDEDSNSFCTNQVHCCGEAVEQPSDCPIESGCRFCPATEPVDGTPCTLPPACDVSPDLQVIDCYYSCCCYGQASWAQCDGTRWHIITNCSPK